MTINGLRDGLTDAIETAFPGIPVVTEDETAQRPYIVAAMTQGSQTTELGKRYRRSQSFEVRYYGSDSREMYDAADMLYVALENIVVDGDYCRGTNMRHTLADGALHFSVDYSFLVWLERPVAATMRKMEQEGGLKP